MFNVQQTQTVADSLKGLIPRQTPTQRQAHRAVTDTLHRFEGAGWHPDAFQAALDQTPGFAVTYQQGRLSFAYEPVADAPAAVRTLLETYLELIGGVGEDDEEDVEPSLPGVYDIAEAAAYLGMSPRAVKHHYHVSKKLEGRVWHNRVVFTRDQLEAFKSIPVRPGRPWPQREGEAS